MGQLFFSLFEKCIQIQTRLGNSLKGTKLKVSSCYKQTANQYCNVLLQHSSFQRSSSVTARGTKGIAVNIAIIC